MEMRLGCCFLLLERLVWKTCESGEEGMVRILMGVAGLQLHVVLECFAMIIWVEGLSELDVGTRNGLCHLVCNSSTNRSRLCKDNHS